MSKAFVVRYQTTAEAADENQRRVEDVYAELAATDPGGLRYLTLRLADGVTFVHIALVDDDGAGNPLPGTAAFRTFQAGLPDRLTQGPDAQDATIVGAYR
jgi:hypothetical protein